MASHVVMSDAELDELTIKVEFMLTQLRKVQVFIDKMNEVVDEGTFNNTHHGMTLLDVKVHLFISYCTKLCLYISMRAKGESVANHELLDQLAITCWILDKLRTIQKNCQYSIDKLLEYAKKAKNSSDSGSTETVAMKDELSHKPNLDALRPPSAGNLIDRRSAGAPAGGDDEDPLHLKYKPAQNEDGIYRPLKLNPKLMDSTQNMLSKKEERKVEKLRRKVRNSDIYKTVKEQMTDAPTEEKIFLKNRGRYVKEFKSDNHDLNNWEEDNMIRHVSTNRRRKDWVRRDKAKENREATGQDVYQFMRDLDKSFTDARRLGDFEAGGKFNETIAKGVKGKFKGNKYIPGGWRKRNRILFQRSKKGKQIARRKTWRKSHPRIQNPKIKLRQIKVKKANKFKKSLNKLKRGAAKR